MCEYPIFTSNSWERKKKYQLAIVIATYNRSNQLQKLLLSLETELDGIEDLVQVVISSNSSSDNTNIVVKNFIDKNSKISIEFYDQKKNIGPNQNIFFVVDKAKANYVWHISDDDLLVSGRVKSILELMVDKHYPLILVRVAGHSQWDSIRYDDDSVICIENVSPFSQEGASYLFASSFLASVVFRADRWRAVENDASRLFSTCYATWAAVLYIASTSEAIGVINAPCVLGNASMLGPSRIPRYEVLVMGRVRVWETLELGPIKSNIKPYIIKLIRGIWRAQVGTNPPIIGEWNVIREFLYLWRVGIRSVQLFLYFVLALSMPMWLRNFIRLFLRKNLIEK